MKVNHRKLTISIPEAYRKMLNNTNEESQLLSLISTIEPLYNDNTMPFFGEYTDHSRYHIQEVIDASVSIISIESSELNTPKNVLALISSILLHDIGMQLSYEGFTQLINGCFDSIQVKYFDQKTWKETWQDYLLESKKFDEKSIRAIFGENLKEDFSIPDLDINKLKFDDLNGYDKKLIGEFIRRHHARLAHEVAIGGFPSKEVIPILEQTSTSIKDVIGLIARSHNLNVRDTFNYLKDIDTTLWFSLYDIHIIFNMIILRLSDLVQIHPERASENSLKFKTLSNPISIGEWSLHQTVTNVSTLSDDPEAIHVTAKPKDSNNYIRLMNLLKYIQYELDLSWAIIGEVYAKNSVLKNLKINFRRITSNIDNPNILREKHDFLPVKATFEAVNNIQNLLIAPLYGNNPSYGIRELLQNAIDACNARVLIEKDSNTEYTPQVSIDIKKETEDKYLFTLKDNGTGMSEEVLINYFLKAGASFRNSNIWQKDFIDDKGQTKVQRAGRFGVGVLATFLLGKTLKVTTRSIKDAKGLSFMAKIDTDQINIIKSVAEIGTSISIELDNKTVNILKDQLKEGHNAYSRNTHWYAWYRLSHPVLKISLPEEWGAIPEFALQPSISEPIGIYSHSFQPTGYNKVIWSYNEKIPSLICNGILIPGGYKQDYRVYKNYPDRPSLSVFDYNGNLPLQLNRYQLDGDIIPFQQELLEEIYKDLIAFALAIPAIKPTKSNVYTNQGIHLHPGYSTNHLYYNFPFIAYTYNGYTFTLGKCLENAKIENIVEIWFKTRNQKQLYIKEKNCAFIFHPFSPESIYDYSAALLRTFKTYSYDRVLMNIESEFKCIKINTKKYQFLVEPSHKRMPASLKNTYQPIDETDNWTTLFSNIYMGQRTNIDKKVTNILTTPELNKNKDAISLVIISKIKCFINSDSLEDQTLLKIIKQYLGKNTIIPYDMEERKKLYPKAFKELATHITKYSTILNSKD